MKNFDDAIDYGMWSMMFLLLLVIIIAAPFILVDLFFEDMKPLYFIFYYAFVSAFIVRLGMAFYESALTCLLHLMWMVKKDD